MCLAYCDAFNEGLVPFQMEFYTFRSKDTGLYFLEFERPPGVWPLRLGTELRD